MKRRMGILVAAVGALLAPVAFGATTVKRLTVAQLAEVGAFHTNGIGAVANHITYKSAHLALAVSDISYL